MQLSWSSLVALPRFMLSAFPPPPGAGRHPHDEGAPSRKGGALGWVLVVDDDAEVRSYLRTCLKPLTRHILEASDGEEALRLARSTSDLALVIADVIMPRMDGLALRDALRADPRLAHVPVLLITGDATLAGEILKKPFNARTLRARIAPLLPS